MWHTLSADEVRKKLNTDIYKGLTDKEVLKLRKKYGYNKLDEKKKESIFIKFISQFKDFMIIILLIAALVSAIVSYFEGTKEYTDSIIIVVIVVINALIGVIQESKAEKSLEALKKLSSPTSKVLRNGKNITIDSTLLVPGDIIELEAGNFVPADCRLISSYNLKIEESALTGETVPVTKDAKVRLPSNIALGDMINMAFSTTIVTNGHAQAIVTETGMNTKVGKIAKMIITDEAPPPESAQSTLPSPTFSRIAAIVSSTKDPICQSPVQPHTSYTKLRSIFCPSFVCITSGWNCVA